MKPTKKLLPLLLSFGMVFTISSFNSIKVKADTPNPKAQAAEQEAALANPDAFFNNPDIFFGAKIRVAVALLSNHRISEDVRRQVSLLFLNTALNNPNLPEDIRRLALLIAYNI
jgi:hypothetical protein